MSDFNISLADLNIKIKPKYGFLEKFCSEYITDNKAPFDIYAAACDADIQREQSSVPAADIAVCESLCVYRAIAEQLPQFDRFVFHGAAIEYGKKAYLFTAPSGTGKTTHINLWKKNLENAVNIINGDKPIISLADTATVYGTPWAGKEGYSRNASAPLKAICVLKQGKTNKIERLSHSEAINRLMRQVYLPQDADALNRTLSLLGKLIETTPVYELCCDISSEAFNISFNTLTKGEI